MSVDNVAVVPATHAHAVDLAGRMREADRDEVWASSLSSPLEALERSMVRTPQSWAGTVNGRVECIYGAAPHSLLSDSASPWLLGSADLARYSIPFLRRNRAFIASVSERYPLLTNYVDARNKLSIRWLRWLGFAIMSPIPYGAFGLPFHPFEFRTPA